MISIIIPAYQNTADLVATIKKNSPYFEDCEVIVVNDDPTTSIKRDLSQFKGIRLTENKKNLGFAGAANRGAREASGKYLLLLNSDVALQDSNYKKSLKYFEKDASLFAVSFAQEESDQKIVGKNRVYWKNGFFQHDSSSTKKGITAWAEGGSAIFDKKKLDALGGFDELYSPFYWEDIDLSYRAWRAGYTVLFDPSILVIHHHGSTINKFFARSTINKTSYRNQFIFIWKNITDLTFIASHIAHLFYMIPRSVIRGDGQLAAGFLAALVRIPQILRQRRKVKKFFIKTDREVLRLF